MALYCRGNDLRYHPVTPKIGKLYSHVLPGFWIKSEWFWQGPILDTYEMAKEMGIVIQA